MASVLVVDDDPVVLQATRDRLRRAGYRVVTARTAERAMKLLADGAIRVVLLDAMMPGRTDSIFLLELAAARLTRNVVLYSGLERVELAELARTTGVAGAIQKTGDIKGFLADFRHFWDLADGLRSPRVA